MSHLTSLSPFPYLFLCRGRGVAGDRDSGHETDSGSYSCVYSHSFLSLPPPPPAQNKRGHRDGNDAGFHSGSLLTNVLGEKGCDHILAMLERPHSCLSRKPRSSLPCLNRSEVRWTTSDAAFEEHGSDNEAPPPSGSVRSCRPAWTGWRCGTPPGASEHKTPQRMRTAGAASLVFGLAPSPARSVAPLLSSPPSFSKAALVSPSSPVALPRPGQKLLVGRTHRYFRPEGVLPPALEAERELPLRLGGGLVGQLPRHLTCPPLLFLFSSCHGGVGMRSYVCGV